MKNVSKVVDDDDDSAKLKTVLDKSYLFRHHPVWNACFQYWQKVVFQILFFDSSSLAPFITTIWQNTFFFSWDSNLDTDDSCGKGANKSSILFLTFAISGADVNNKFSCSIIMLCFNNALWMVKNVTWNIQSECLISVLHNFATLEFVYYIGSCGQSYKAL